ncbi:hypothetical protein AMTRI_Chr07g79070 [Amborella trichopoda]
MCAQTLSLACARHISLYLNSRLGEIISLYLNSGIPLSLPRESPPCLSLYCEPPPSLSLSPPPPPPPPPQLLASNPRFCGHWNLSHWKPPPFSATLNKK